MEEQNKQSEQEQEVQESVEEKPTQETPLRSSVIMLLAGAYLLYTGYKLCQDVLNGANGSKWGFFAAGVGFLIVGVVMLIVGGRDLMKRDKAKREAEAAAQEQTQEQPESEPVEQKKSMSIAERAHLADELGDEVTQTGSERTTEGVSLDKESNNRDSE